MKKKLIIASLASIFLSIPAYAGLSEQCYPSIECDSAEDYYAGQCQPHIETVADDCPVPIPGNFAVFSCDDGCYERTIPQPIECPGGIDVGGGDCLSTLNVLDNAGIYSIYDGKNTTPLVHMEASCADGEVPTADLASATGWSCAANGGGGYWQQTGGGIYYEEGNVGIGDSSQTPTATLDVGVSGAHTGAVFQAGFTINDLVTAGDYSVAMGSQTKSTGNVSFAMGYRALASGLYTAAIGNEIEAQASTSFVIGQYNLTNPAYNKTVWNLNDPVFVIGNGTNPFNRSNAMTVLKNGKVGIGTATPLAQLQVTETSGSGNVTLAGTDSGVTAVGDSYAGYFADSDSTGAVWVASGDTGITATGSTYGGYFSDADNTSYAYLGFGDLGIQSHGAAGGGYFNDTDILDEDVYLASNLYSMIANGPITIQETNEPAIYIQGDSAIEYNETYFTWGDGGSHNYFPDAVGIGTNSPDYKFHVEDSIVSNVVAKFENTNTATTSDGISIQIGPIANPGTSNDFIQFRDGDGSLIGQIDGTGAGGVNYTTVSDARLKTNVQDYKGALDVLMKVRPVSYSFKTNPDLKQVGFLAQELQKVYPSAVSGSANSDVNVDPMGIDYGALTPLLASAIQEQQILINQLRSALCQEAPGNKICNQ